MVWGIYTCQEFQEIASNFLKIEQQQKQKQQLIKIHLF